MFRIFEPYARNEMREINSAIRIKVALVKFDLTSMFKFLSLVSEDLCTGYNLHRGISETVNINILLKQGLTKSTRFAVMSGGPKLKNSRLSLPIEFPIGRAQPTP